MPALRQLLALVLLAITAASTSPGQSSHVAIGPERTIAPDMLGINGNLMSLPEASLNLAFIDAFKSTHTPLFRFPAGTIANTWDWDIGGLDPSTPTEDLIGWVQKLDRPAQPAHPYDIPEIARIHHATGATITFVLNMLTKDLEHSLRGLRLAREAGIPIKYVEMGNELYFNLPLESRVFPTPEHYGRVCEEWIQAIKIEFPGVLCALVAGGKPHKDRSKNWIERALTLCPSADAIVVHNYTPTGLNGLEKSDVTAGTEGLTDVDLSQSPSDRQAREFELLTTPTGFARTMTRAYAATTGVNSYYERTQKPIWLTEWNLRADHDAFRGTWAHTLFIATMLHGILDTPSIKISHYHNILSPIFGAIYQEPTELSHILNQELKSQPWSLTAGGLALSLFNRVANGRTAVAPVTLPGGERLMSAQGSLPAVYGWRFHREGADTATVLVNLSSTPISLETTALANLHAPVQMYHGQLTTYIEGPDSVPLEKSTLGPFLSLPAYSITLINPTDVLSP